MLLNDGVPELTGLLLSRRYRTDVRGQQEKLGVFFVLSLRFFCKAVLKKIQYKKKKDIT